jgi:hypothetical protein
MQEGLLALAVGTGLQVMHAIMQEDASAVSGPRGKHLPARSAVLQGTEEGSVTVVARCQHHKIRSVGDKLPDHLAAAVTDRTRAAYHAESALAAESDSATSQNEPVIAA